ncbi:MAG: DapH/DapD/GlmU-related protein [Bacteroidota bacterium]|nr:DapH/DapD/GlmU-related protein [Bacteroidota bacterium]
MYRIKNLEIYASEIAEFLNQELSGENFIVKNPASINNIKENSLLFIENEKFNIEKIAVNNVLVISKLSFKHKNNVSLIISKNPKLDFLRILNEFFIENDIYKISDSAKIDSRAKIDRNVSIGENVVIGADVIIKNNTQILNNVVINGSVEIGSNCIIKDNSTIGGIGYDFETDENGLPYYYPHIGKIIIEDNVWIGSNTSIESASLDNTIIHKHVKIDDLVQIGCNCIINKSSMITAGVIVSRNVLIGENCWIAPNATIIEDIKIGDNVTVGAGSVVLNDLENDSVYVGNPAYLLKTKK